MFKTRTIQKKNNNNNKLHKNHAKFKQFQYYITNYFKNHIYLLYKMQEKINQIEFPIR